MAGIAPASQTRRDGFYETTIDNSGTMSTREASETLSGTKTFTATPVLSTGTTIDVASTTATLVSNAATITEYAAQITSESLTTASGSTATFVITKVGVAATTLAILTPAGGTNTKKSLSWETVCTTDTVTVKVTNITGSNLDGTLIFNLLLLKP